MYVFVWAVLGLLILVSGFVFRSISRAMDELGTGPQYDMAALDRLKRYLIECISKYGDDYQYSTDPRLLKIWILYVTWLILYIISDLIHPRLLFIILLIFFGVFCDSFFLGRCNWGLPQCLQPTGGEKNVSGACATLWLICTVSNCSWERGWSW